MQNLIPTLRVKVVTIFDLLDQEFHYGEFIFFPRLAAYLGRIAAISMKDAQEIGQISELVYLYAKIHVSVKERALEDPEFCSSVQMPVLLGDLFLGRFYRMLAEYQKEDCLPVYLEYMGQLSGHEVDRLQVHKKAEADDYYITLLVQKVADAIAILAGENAPAKENLQNAAANYLQEQWALLYGERIGSVAELEEKLQAEMF